MRDKGVIYLTVVSDSLSNRVIVSRQSQHWALHAFPHYHA